MISRRQWIAAVSGCLALAAFAAVPHSGFAAPGQKLEVTYYYLPG